MRRRRGVEVERKGGTGVRHTQAGRRGEEGKLPSSYPLHAAVKTDMDPYPLYLLNTFDE